MPRAKKRRAMAFESVLGKKRKREEEIWGGGYLAMGSPAKGGGGRNRT